jgi:hypothetical protein
MLIKKSKFLNLLGPLVLLTYVGIFAVAFGFLAALGLWYEDTTWIPSEAKILQINQDCRLHALRWHSDSFACDNLAAIAKWQKIAPSVEPVAKRVFAVRGRAALRLATGEMAETTFYNDDRDALNLKLGEVITVKYPPSDLKEFELQSVLKRKKKSFFWLGILGSIPGFLLWLCFRLGWAPKDWAVQMNGYASK